jgi:Zn-dependent protease with chaperone function
LGAVNVVVVHDPLSVMMFMNLDQTLFITTKALEVTNLQEPELMLLLTHELAHYLLE